MNWKTRWSNRNLARGLRHRELLDFECMETRILLSMTYTVINTNATGSGSLYDAITQLDMSAATPSSPNVIQFNIPGGGAQTINLTQQLPDLTQPTDVQGYTQPGSSPNTNPLTMGDNAVLTVIVSGNDFVANGLIVDASAAGSVISGLDLEGVAGPALRVNANDVSVTGSFVGVAPDGQPTVTTTNQNGVIVGGSSGVSIGGTLDADRNVLTGDSIGLTISPAGPTSSSNTLVEGNIIGSNADGTPVTDLVLRNDIGLEINQGAGDTIGGTSTGSGNIISGSTSDGVEILSSSGEVLAGDIIESSGLDGVSLLSSHGISILSSTIGGFLASLGNSGVGVLATGSVGLAIIGDVIDDNATGGLALEDGSNSASVTSSTIGGTAAAEDGMYNTGYFTAGGYGILVAGSFSGTIGGTSAGAGDVIEGSAGDGILIEASFNTGSSYDPQVLDSQILDNGGVGVVIMDTTDAILTSDTISTNMSGGVLLSNSPRTVVDSSPAGGMSSIGFNGGYGVSLLGSTDTTLGGTALSSGLVVYENKGPGIAIEPSSFTTSASDRSSVLNSLISSNVGDGIDVVATLGVSLVGDTVEGNAGGGISLSQDSAGTISGANVFQNGSYAGGGSFGISSYFSSLELDHSTITGNSGIGLSILGSIYNSYSGPTVTGTTIQSNKGGGLLLTGSTIAGFPSGGTIESSTIGGATPALGNGGFGVSITGSLGVTIGGLSAGSGVTVSDNHGVGIAIDTAILAGVFGSTILGNQGDGIDAYSSTGGINGDAISANLGGGILLSEGSIFGVADATVSGNGPFGIRADGSDIQLESSTITGNNGIGVSIMNPTITPSVTGVTIQSNKGGGLLLSGSTLGGTIASSTIGGTTPALGNGGFGVSLVSSPNVAIGSLNGNVLSQFNGGDGIDLAESAGAKVSTATSMNNGGAGLNITSPSLTVSGSNVLMNAGSGIEVSGLTNNFTTGSSLYDAGNKGFGVLILDSAGNTIGGAGQSTTISFNGANGVEILGTDSNDNLVQLATISSNGVNGVAIEAGASSNVIRSDVVSRNAQSGVQIDSGATTNYVVSALIGTDLSGANAGNGFNGVSIAGASENFIEAGSIILNNLANGVSIADGSDNHVIGSGNTIAFNGQSGVQITGSDSSLNQIDGSMILGNALNGVTISLARATIIGGVSQPDVISANRVDGISIEGSQNVGTGTPTVIEASFIGTDPTGLAGLGNGYEGIHIGDSSGIQIGSMDAGGSDVVSSNVVGGIELSNSSNNTLFGDRIGTDFLGRYVVTGAISPLGQGFGVFVNQSSGNLIGGTAVGAGNIIAGLNTTNDFGILLLGPLTVNNQVVGNSIGVTDPIGAASTVYALGDHVGVYINGAQHTLIQANSLGGSDLGEILVSAGEPVGIPDSPVISTTIIGNTIDGSYFPPNSIPPNNLAKPIGIVVANTQGTLVVYNTIEGLSVGVDVVGAPAVPPTPASTIPQSPFKNALSTIAANVISNDEYGVRLDGSPSNLVTGNIVMDSSVVGVEVYGPQSVGNTIGGTANYLIDNPYGVYLEDAQDNQIVGNMAANTAGYNNPSQTQVGIYLFNALTELNTVASNTITGMNSYGILFLNTPQAPDEANLEVNNAVSGSTITNIETNRASSNLQPLDPPTPILVPTTSTPPTVSASSVKVQVSLAFSVRRPPKGS